MRKAGLKDMVPGTELTYGWRGMHKGIVLFVPGDGQIRVLVPGGGRVWVSYEEVMSVGPKPRTLPDVEAHL